MNKTIHSLAIAAFLACFAFSPDAGAAPETKKSLPAPHWQSDDGSATEVWLVERGDGAIALHGRDLVSGYAGLLVPGEAEGTWVCTGTGFRFEGGLAFAYRSSFTLETADAGPSLVEIWTATLSNGEVIEGKTVLKPVARPKTE